MWWLLLVPIATSGAILALRWYAVIRTERQRAYGGLVAPDMDW